MAHFTTYKQMLAWVKKGHKKEQGRRISTYRIRIGEDHETLVITHAYRMYKRPDQLIDIAHVYPNDTITFLRTTAELRIISASLCMTLRKLVSLGWRSRSRDKYTITSRGPSQSIEARYAPGLTFNFFTGACLNPGIYRPPVVNASRSKVWRESLKEFNREFMLRVKLGVLASILEGTATKTYGRYELKSMMDSATLEALRTGVVDTDYLSLCVQYSRAQSWSGSATVDSVVKSIMGTISRNRTEYKIAFGALEKVD